MIGLGSDKNIEYWNFQKRNQVRPVLWKKCRFFRSSVFWWNNPYACCGLNFDATDLPHSSSENRYTSKFSGVLQKLTLCQRFGLHLLPKWKEVDFLLPQKGRWYLIFVKKFTRPNFWAKEFYTLKTRKLRPFSPAIKQHKCIIITNLVLCWLKYKKMCRFINSYEESWH